MIINHASYTIGFVYFIDLSYGFTITLKSLRTEKQSGFAKTDKATM